MKQWVLLLKITLDFISIPFVIIVSYSLKFKWGLLSNILFQTNSGKIYHTVQIEPYLTHIFSLSVASVVIFLIMGLYKSRTTVLPKIDESIQITKSVSVAILILMATSFIYDIFPESRYVLIFSWGVAIIVMMLTRLLVIQKIEKYFNLNKSRICMIGVGPSTQHVLEFLLQSNIKEEYVCSFAYKEPTSLLFKIKQQFSYKQLNEVASLFLFLVQYRISKVYVESSELKEKELQELILMCEKNNIEICILDTKSSVLLHGVANIAEIDGIPMITYPSFSFSENVQLIKRICDIVGAIVALVVLAPVMILIALWITCVSSKGGVFYKQERVGYKSQTFWMYKFRTMSPDAESQSGPVWVEKQDTRYIYGGHLLRRFSLDELPQLFNVLKNEMSLIGPRPERPYFVKKITENIPHFELRHGVKGGLTGWAQVNGRAYMTNKPAQKVKYDLYYISNWSLILDVKIIIKTIQVIFKGEQAY